VPEGGLNFRRFLGLAEKPAERLTELAPKSEDPPPGEMLVPRPRRAAESRTPASPISKAAPKFPETQKDEGGTAVPPTSSKTRREPVSPAAWRSQRSRAVQTSWADQLNRPF